MKRMSLGQIAPQSRLMGGGYVSMVAATMLTIVMSFSAGCSSDNTFAKVNGKPITTEEYIKALERQQVQVGQSAINAGRIVLDQIIGQKIILDEASKLGVLPTEADVNNYYEFRKKLFEAQFPNKKFEDQMKEQGSTAEELKTEIKYQLAETNVYAKRLNVGRDEIQKTFEQFKGQYLPARVLLRLIVAYPNSPEYKEAEKQLKEKIPFDDVAKKVNLPNLVGTGGLLPQPTPISQINPKYQTEVQKKSDGDYFGPVDFNIAQGAPPAKAWIKIEKKLPAYTVTLDEALFDVTRQVVQAKIMDGANAKVRDEIMKTKMDATFEPIKPAYKDVWESIKKQAQEAGIGKIATGEVPATGGMAPAPTGEAPAPVAPAPGAPGGAAKTN